MAAVEMGHAGSSVVFSVVRRGGESRAEIESTRMINLLFNSMSKVLTSKYFTGQVEQV